MPEYGGIWREIVRSARSCLSRISLRHFRSTPGTERPDDDSHRVVEASVYGHTCPPRDVNGSPSVFVTRPPASRR